MIFTELRFLVFFVAVFAVHWALPANRPRKVWLLIASYTFYAAWDWRFLSLILISTGVDYLVGLGLGRTREPKARRALMVASLVTNLGLLGFFKYFGFFVDSALELGDLLGLTLHRPSLEIVLPVGISFYTFQTLSYSIDVFRRKLEPTRDLLDLALFVAFFPQLVAGPIVRAAAFLPQLQRTNLWHRVRVAPHLTLFLLGFVKKACVSDNVAATVDAYFASPQSYDAAGAWIAVLLYAIQIYCDFSGYSDMAIASAGLLGYDLGPNFRHPYVASSPREFWQRWHISLSTWLRDYLYIPLGGSRGGELATHRNLMVTMLLGGLWHGAAWSFVLWGGLHGDALSVHRLWRRWNGAATRDSLPRIAAGIVATQALVCLGWILFRAHDLERAWVTARSWLFFHSPGTETIDSWWWVVIVGFSLTHALGSRRSWGEALWRAPGWRFAVGYGVAVAVVLLFVQVDVQPFLYFQF